MYDTDDNRLRLYTYYAAELTDLFTLPNGGPLTDDQASFLFDVLVDGMEARQLTEEEVREMLPRRLTILEVPQDYKRQED